MESQFITPALSVFDAKGRPDREENHRLYAHLQRGGVSGFVIMGSTGEFFSLDMQRSMALIDIAAAFPRGAMRVFAGASRMDPEESVALANYAHDKGLDGVMIVSPYYFPFSQDNVFDFYSAVASRTPADIFVYNFPARTGYSVSPETALKLADRHPNVRGFKDTIPDMTHTCDLIKQVKSRLPYFEIFSGYDNNFAHNVFSGGNGCIGGLSNIVPEFFGDWMRTLAGGDLAAMARCQRYADELMEFYNIGDPFIPILKTALMLRGVITSGVCTPPFHAGDASQAGRIRALLDATHIGRAAS